MSEQPASWQIPCYCGCPGSVATADIEEGDRDVRTDEAIAIAFRDYRQSFTRVNGRLFEHRAGDEGGPDTRAIRQEGRCHWMLPAGRSS